MEALVPAFLAALLTQIGDGPAWLTALMADRYRRPLMVFAAAVLAHGAGNVAAALLGQLLAPMLTPNAAALFLAVALVFGAVPGLWPVAAPDRLAGWRLGGFLTPLLGLAILALGDRTQFLTLALAARGGFWGFAAIGATLGAGAVAGAAAFLGERGWLALPLRALRIAIALVLLVAGIWTGLGAARLI